LKDTSCTALIQYPFYCTNINSDVHPFQFSSIVSGSPYPYNLVHKEHSKGEKKGVKNSKEQFSDLLTSDQ
jgi:hypothetical protein